MLLSARSKFDGHHRIKIKFRETRPAHPFGAGFVGCFHEAPETHVFGWSPEVPVENTVRVSANHLAPVPGRIAGPGLACVASSGMAAWQALRDVGYVRPGQSVLIVNPHTVLGQLAEQLAGALGAQLAGHGDAPCDVILDCDGDLTPAQVSARLSRGGKYIRRQRWYWTPSFYRLALQPGRASIRRLPHRVNRIDLEDLGELVTRRIIRLDGLDAPHCTDHQLC